MGIIDWIILAVLLVFAVQGFRKGLVGGILQICGAIAAFFLVAHFYPLVRNNLILNFKLNNILATIFAVVLIAIVVLVLVRLLIWLINRILKAMHLGFVNKLLGLGFGLVFGLICFIVLMVVLDYAPKLSTPLKDPEKHRVYVAIDTLKEDLFTRLKLTERERYREIVESLKKEKEAEKTAE